MVETILLSRNFPSQGLYSQRFIDVPVNAKTDMPIQFPALDKDQVAIGFHLVGQTSLAQSHFDKVTIDLASHEVIAS